MPFREEQLDNPVWWALRGEQSPFAIASDDGSALRYRPTVSVFAAVDDVDARAWTALRQVAGPGGVVALMRAEIGPVSDGWTEVFRGAVVQMVAPTVAPDFETHPDVTELTEEDGDDMFTLATTTRPGPFEARTSDLGRFVGVRRDGALVAMAGERFRISGATEISAVCTAETERGQGWGAQLTLEVARHIQARGEVAFLHVEPANPALALYERLGFTQRRQSVVVAATRVE
ncbi:MAG: GNAT family N-acetyltransferase [Acidimicrobiales bacterium]